MDDPAQRLRGIIAAVIALRRELPTDGYWYGVDRSLGAAAYELRRTLREAERLAGAPPDPGFGAPGAGPERWGGLE